MLCCVVLCCVVLCCVVFCSVLFLGGFSFPVFPGKFWLGHGFANSLHGRKLLTEGVVKIITK